MRRFSRRSSLACSLLFPLILTLVSFATLTSCASAKRKVGGGEGQVLRQEQSAGGDIRNYSVNVASGALGSLVLLALILLWRDSRRIRKTLHAVIEGVEEFSPQKNGVKAFIKKRAQMRRVKEVLDVEVSKVLSKCGKNLIQ